MIIIHIHDLIDSSFFEPKNIVDLWSGHGFVVVGNPILYHHIMFDIYCKNIYRNPAVK